MIPLIFAVAVIAVTALALRFAIRESLEPLPPPTPEPETPESQERWLREMEHIKESHPETWSSTPLTEEQLRRMREENEAHRVPMSKRPDYGPWTMVGRPTWEREPEK